MDAVEVLFLSSAFNEAFDSVRYHRELEMLEDNELDDLKWCLGEFMPLDSIMIDLRDWNIHFESELCDDWFLSAAFGHTDTLDSCSTDLADFFLEKVDEYGMDYDQHSDREGFEDWIRKESMKFIENWRRNIATTPDGKALRDRRENKLQVEETV